MHKVALNFNDGKTEFISVEPSEMVLDAALRQGLTLPVDCREGVCATCKGRCVSGQYDLEYVDEDALTEAELEDGGVLTCQMQTQSDCAINFDFASTLCGSAGPQHFEASITGIELKSESTAIIHLDVPDYDQQIDFLPGQYAHIKIPGTEEWRSYSFACEPNKDNKLQLLIRLLPDGVMSNYLRDKAKPGDTLLMAAPLGAFYLQKITRPLIFVAGGTGLSAFLGMLDQMANGSNTTSVPVTLFYGVTQTEDLCELERLEDYKNKIAQFEFHTTVMKPDQKWAGNTGVVTELFAEEHFHGGDVDCYLCGPPPMVDAVKAWLDKQNMTKSKIYFEKFSAS